MFMSFKSRNRFTFDEVKIKPFNSYYFGGEIIRINTKGDLQRTRKKVKPKGWVWKEQWSLVCFGWSTFLGVCAWLCTSLAPMEDSLTTLPSMPLCVCLCVCVCVCLDAQSCLTPVMPQTVTRQAPLSMGFSR